MSLWIWILLGVVLFLTALVRLLLVFYGRFCEEEQRCVEGNSKFLAHRAFVELVEYQNADLDRVFEEFLGVRKYFEAFNASMEQSFNHNLLVYLIMQDEMEDRGSVYTFYKHYMDLLKLVIDRGGARLSRSELYDLYCGR